MAFGDCPRGIAFGDYVHIDHAAKAHQAVRRDPRVPADGGTWQHHHIRRNASAIAYLYEPAQHALLLRFGAL
jgi:hypothetical protein